MKAWHVTCTCAIQLLFPLAYVSCLWDWIGWVAQDLCSKTNCSLGVTSGCQLPSKGPMCWSMVFLTPFSRGVSVNTSWKVRLTSLPSKRQMNFSASSQIRFFFPWGLHSPTGRKDTFACSTWRTISRDFFLNGTWSWPKGCSSGISFCLGVNGGNTRGVGVWLNLRNWLHLVNRRIQNNLWWGTWSIPNDPTGCRCLFSLKLGQDGQGREKGWRVVKNSCRVLLV